MTITHDRVSAAIGDEGRGDDDRVHDGGGQHERHRGAGRQPLRREASSDRHRAAFAHGEGHARGRGGRELEVAGERAIFANADAGTKTSIAAETNAPRKMNGIASTSNDPNTISRLRTHPIRSGSMTPNERSRARRSPRIDGEAHACRRRSRGRGSAASGVARRRRRPSAVPRERDRERRERVRRTRRRRPGRAVRPIASRRPASAVIERCVDTARSRNRPPAALGRDRSGSPATASTRAAIVGGVLTPGTTEAPGRRHHERGRRDLRPDERTISPVRAIHPGDDSSNDDPDQRRVAVGAVPLVQERRPPRRRGAPTRRRRRGRDRPGTSRRR